MLATGRTTLKQGAFLIAGFAFFASTAAAADKVVWRNDYDAARKEATENGKLLLLDFGTEDCVHCKRMHQTTFRDPAIMKILNERFIALRIDANREPRLAQSLRIQAYPTIVLAGNDGKILAWVEGFIEVNRLVEQLNRASTLQTPEWMARDSQEANRAINTGDHARAITLLKNIVEDGKDRPVQAKAREALQEIELLASGRLARARQFDEKGQTLEAIDLLTELGRKYAGTKAAVEGTKLLTNLAEKADVRSQLRNRRAKELLALAKEDVKGERLLAGLELYETLASNYRDLPEGKEAEQHVAEIKGNADQMARICEAMGERLAAMYLTQADAWLKKGNSDQAVASLEQVLKVKTTGVSAEQAQLRLGRMQGRTPGISVSFPKPQ